MTALRRYIHWLHTGWPSGDVNRLPEVRPDGTTRVDGLLVAGDLRGVPLLKFAAESGARIVRTIASGMSETGTGTGSPDEPVDVAIVGGGVAGMSAALEAKRLGLSFVVLEAARPFATVAHFPAGKPILAYPPEMIPQSGLSITASDRESLLRELMGAAHSAGIETVTARAECVLRDGEHLRVVVPNGDDVTARRVVVAIGRSGDYRRLGVPGEDGDSVTNRLHDPAVYRGKAVVVAGGGDTALEAAAALARAGAQVVLSYRGAAFTRPKPENAGAVAALAEGREAAPGSLRVIMESRITEIAATSVSLVTATGPETVSAEAVFVLIGSEPPLHFFRRSGVPISGEWTRRRTVSLAAVLSFCTLLYHWKSGGAVTAWFRERALFPFHFTPPVDPSGPWEAVAVSATSPGFWYSLAYTILVAAFGVLRVRRRPTPYIRAQTWSLAVLQIVPLFLLPYLLLPWMGTAGWFDEGVGATIAEGLFPITEWDPHGREYWRASGFILAWPLFLWNAFTDRPMGLWLLIGSLQTFVLIPWLVRRWGKGAYCGWICSCGALAETLGDAHRHRMPHGPRTNQMNAVGQAVLALAALLLLLRVVAWAFPEASIAKTIYMALHMGRDASWNELPFPGNYLNYAWFVDLLLSGIIGVGLYFHFSGRAWCRFVCPLAALMHIYARAFGRFRIFSEKKKCISCNLCTSVCHQGIDVMGFANRGLPMEDPQCVRCSACVVSCPTGVLSFGRVNANGEVAAVDRVRATLRLEEGK
ncbi:MAG: NAD(P)-binding domain-containing protein [Gemmatimonadota bacterium]|jgi:thioredoxin reductase|nr:NAD(P)-binding domain-containing protein [Gemmatimonadota bacterium]MDP6802920.1 NAD(P)-binding domain-containing protein [Gemmatimonadota bacterium]MDP7031410.1 NAD(P)-binding domain-containing protein [Gemmatimonadota bacterium]